MRVLVIGGAGKVGFGVAKGLASKKEVSKVILSSRNLRAIEEAARQIGDKAEPIGLNVDEHASVVTLMRETDLVVNAIGPGLRYAVPLAEAALEARRNLVDVQDDAEAIPGLLALDDKARNAGVTIITGMGVTPGLSGLWARRAANRMNQVGEIHITWVCNMTLTATAGNWGHRLAMYGQPVTIFDKGQFVDVEGGSGEEVVEWPKPVGKLAVAFCGHTEPLTMPRYINKGIKHVSIKGALTPPEHNEFVKHLASLGLTSTELIEVNNVSVVPTIFMREFLTTDVFKATDTWKRLIEREKEIGPIMGLNVEVKGKRNGKVIHIINKLWGPERNAATYIPAWLVAYMVLSGKINMRGVFPPEALDLNPKPIEDELAAAGGVSTEEII